MSLKSVIDRDSKLNYESTGIVRFLLNIFIIPVLSILPARSQKFIKKTHQSANEVIEHKTTHQALEVLYQSGRKEYARTPMQKFFHWLWFHTNNSKAARNRLRLTKREVQKQIERTLAQGKRVELLSIASGSARAIIEVIENYREYSDKINATFVDKNPQAIAYSQQLTRDILGDHKFNLKWVNDTVGSYFRGLNDEENFDLIEIVGLMDYFVDEKVEEIFRHCYRHLKSEGRLITANINKNFEYLFVSRVVGWKMIYRTAEEIATIVHRAGFNESDIAPLYEPLKIHSVIVAQK